MKTSKTILRMILAGMAVFCAVLLALPVVAAAKTPQRQQSRGESFFIISSVDARKQQLVLKLPSEVTEVAQVTPATTYRDEEGKPLKFDDLRAGDTVYATVIQNAKGTLTVTSLRRGPMTLEELHKRYFAEE
ncbi:MAG: hypothetical protein P8Z30_19180 [Acidobacteriota bacterium]